jgi:outer membrane protein OmpA-like peptidoglycan-associated protein
MYGQENYRVKNLGVNTKYSDFGTSFYQGDAIFASARPQDNESRRDWTNGQPYLDLYRGAIAGDGEIMDPTNFSEDLDTRYHESNAIFTKDGKTVYFTRNNYYMDRYGKDTMGWNNLKLFRADVGDNGAWINEMPLPFNDDNYSVGHPALSPDERTLYFTSDMPGSMGATDIFKVSVSGESYGSPINLGSQVNTYGKEMFPYVTQSGKLYFSSDSRGGNGGLDVYMVPTNNQSVAAINLGSPINTASDDFAFIIDEQKRRGYFSSNRAGGKGDDDIYYFDELNAPKEAACSQRIAGVVRDKQSGALLPHSLVSLYQNGKKVESVMTGSDASFAFSKVDCDASYRVTGEKEYYQGDEKTLTTTNEADLELGMDLSLTPDAKAVAATEEVDRCQYMLDDINTIYFDLDKYYIRADAAIELEKIVKTLKKCPQVTIEARSHTDSRASHGYNETLSQNRAQSTVDYIISRGIMSNRLSAKGFGETQLLNRCSDGVNCSEGEHQVNRRTEFVIVRK